MDTIINYYTLPRISEGLSGEAALDALNAPIEATEQALNSLALRVSNLNTKSSIVRHYVPIDRSVVPGTIVYYNTEKACFYPAISALMTTPGSHGESLEAPSSRVEGIIISIDSSGISGTLLCGGYWESKDIANYCLGSDATPGTYYLSSVNSGKAVKTPDDFLKQPLLTYYGDGKLSLNIFYNAQPNHYHSSLILQGAWKPIDTLEDTSTAPSSARFYYDFNSDTQANTLGEIAKDITAVFYNGILQNLTEGPFIIQDGTLFYTEASVPEDRSVILFNHFPFAYNSAVVRNIESKDASLKVNNVNGTVYLEPSAFVSGSVTRSNLAVSAISGNVIMYTPVVTGVSAGPGINIGASTNGNIVVSSSDLLGSNLDAYNVNHNGTVVTSDGFLQYFTFPSGRISEMIISLPITGLSGDNSYKAIVWGCCSGTGTTMDTTLYYIQMPSLDKNTEIPSEGISSSITFVNTQNNIISYAESVDSVSVSGDGLLVARLKLRSSLDTDVKLMRVGFKVSLNNTSDDSDIESPDDIYRNAVTGTLPVGYSAAKYDIVYPESGVLQLCRATLSDAVNKCVGVTLSASGSSGDVEYIMSGIIQDTSFTWEPGKPIYVGKNGRMTQTPPSDAGVFVQKIGIALTRVIVQINIEPAIILENNA